jgi:TPR repeat protein
MVTNDVEAGVWQARWAPFGAPLRSRGPPKPREPWRYTSFSVGMPMKTDEALELKDAYRNLASGRNHDAIVGFQALENKGVVEAKRYMGFIYERGLGVPADSATAERYYRQAAEQNDILSQRYLARLLKELGRNEEALKWYSRAAESGSASAEYWLYVMYKRGIGAAVNANSAMQHLERSALKGHLFAKRDLALAYLRGSFGVSGRLRGLPMLLMTFFKFSSVLGANSDDLRS